MKHSLIETKDIDGHKKKSFEIMKGKDGDVYQIKGISSENKDDTFHVKERMIHKGINQHRTFKIKSSDLQNIIRESTRKIYSKDINKQKKIDIIKDSKQYPKVIKCPCKNKKLNRYTPGLIDQAICKVIKIKSKKQTDKNIKGEINPDKNIKIEKLMDVEKYYNTDNKVKNKGKNNDNIKKIDKGIPKKIEKISDKVIPKKIEKISDKVIPKKVEKISDKVIPKKVEKKSNKEKNKNKIEERINGKTKIEKNKFEK